MHFHLFIHCVCVNFRFNRTAATHSSTDSDSDSEQTAAEQLELDAWDVVRDFASGKITLSEAEEALQEVLGNGYVQSHWLPAFTAVFWVVEGRGGTVHPADAGELCMRLPSSESRRIALDSQESFSTSVDEACLFLIPRLSSLLTSPMPNPALCAHTIDAVTTIGRSRMTSNLEAMKIKRLRH